MAKRKEKKRRLRKKTKRKQPKKASGVGETQGLRTFPEKDGYQSSLRDVYDPCSGADAGLWFPFPSASLHISGTMPSEDQPRIVAGWPDPEQAGQIVAGWLEPADVPTLHDVPDDGELETAAPHPRSDLAPAIERFGKPQEIPRQLTGYWYAPDEELPSAIPPWDPTGALLPSVDADTVSGEFDALSLVYIDNGWRPLSVAAKFTYIHSGGLARGEIWRFTTERRGTIRSYSVELGGELPFEHIATRFGGDAAERARRDRPALLVKARAI